MTKKEKKEFDDVLKRMLSTPPDPRRKTDKRSGKSGKQTKRSTKKYAH